MSAKIKQEIEKIKQGDRASLAKALGNYARKNVSATKLVIDALAEIGGDEAADQIGGLGYRQVWGTWFAAAAPEKLNVVYAAKALKNIPGGKATGWLGTLARSSGIETIVDYLAERGTAEDLDELENLIKNSAGMLRQNAIKHLFTKDSERAKNLVLSHTGEDIKFFVSGMNINDAIVKLVELNTTNTFKALCKLIGENPESAAFAFHTIIKSGNTNALRLIDELARNASFATNKIDVLDTAIECFEKFDGEEAAFILRKISFDFSKVAEKCAIAVSRFKNIPAETKIEILAGIGRYSPEAGGFVISHLGGDNNPETLDLRIREMLGIALNNTICRLHAIQVFLGLETDDSLFQLENLVKKGDKGFPEILSKLAGIGTEQAIIQMGHIARIDEESRPLALQLLTSMQSDNALWQVGFVGGNKAVDILVQTANDTAAQVLQSMLFEGRGDKQKIIHGLLGLKLPAAAIALGEIAEDDAEFQEAALTNLIELRRDFNESAAYAESIPAMDAKIKDLFRDMTQANNIKKNILETDGEDVPAYRTYLVNAAKDSGVVDPDTIASIFDNVAKAVVHLRAHATHMDKANEQQVATFGAAPVVN